MKYIIFLVLVLMNFSVNAFYQCFGTEPFWNLTISNNVVVFNDFNTTTVEAVKEKSSSEKNIFFSTENKKLIMTKSDVCNDGMSDQIYAFEIIISNSETGILHGCCDEK